MLLVRNEKGWKFSLEIWEEKDDPGQTYVCMCTHTPSVEALCR